MKSRCLAVLAALFGIGGLALMLTLLFGPVVPTSAQAPDALRVVVGQSIQNDVSPPLSAIRPIRPSKGLVPIEIPMQPLPKAASGDAKAASGDAKSASGDASHVDPVVQNQPGALNMPSPIVNFEGVNNVDGVLPPDTQGDIGYDPISGRKYYVQWVNVSFAIWDVTITPTLVLSPTNGNTLWTGFGGACETTNDGDPITLFDTLSNRWLMSQFALPNFPNGPFYQCIAISTSADPLGTWYRYAFLVHANKLNDYPKFGVWPDGYYMTVNQFNAGTLSWGGAGVYVFDRANMLAGNPAVFQYFDLFGVNVNFGGMLPSDLDGPILPPPGSPNYFAEVDDAAWIPPDDTLRIWEFHVDWTNPASSTFGIDGQPNVALTTTDWTPLPCVGISRDCIPQPDTSQRLDAIGDRLMYRLAYRNLGSHESLVVNHSVRADGADRAGVRWYEVRDPGGVATIHQQGTYAPADGDYRWMGSIALDHNGNIALGYSVASTNTYPSIRYAGRLAGDPLGTLPQGETMLIAGSGSQTHSAARWGDYSMMGIDPVDDCTFWYTQEYIQITSPADWQTRIGSFRFPSCSIGPQGTLAGVVSDGSNGSPIAGAQLQASANPTQTSSTTSGPDGSYAMLLSVGTYTVTASKYGYLPASIGGVSIVSGTTTTQNIALTPAAFYVVSGTVTDAATGWPLYASLSIFGYPGGTIWSNPVTGFYSVTLAEGMTYTFNVNAWVNGYDAAFRVVAPLTSDRTENFGLNANATACIAPGYHQDFVYFEDFELDDGGYITSTTFPTRTTSWAWGMPTSGPGSAHSGVNIWATNLITNYRNNEDGFVASPNIDLSAYAGQTPILAWWQWLRTENNFDFASLEVSNDGGGSWTRVYGEVSGDVDIVTWTQRSVVLNPSYAVGNFRLRFRLRSDSSVVRPGWYVDDIGIAVVPTPPSTLVYSEAFELGDGGYITSTTFPTRTTSWEWGTPSAAPGPGSAHSGVNIWATNLITNYRNNEDGFVASPNIDLSGYPDQVPTVSWWQWLRTERNFDFASLEASDDGGGSWTRVYGEVSGDVDIVTWTQRSAALGSSYMVSDFRLRFRLRSDSSVVRPGWYVDDVTISVSPPFTPTIDCVSQAGGLVVGNVYDANTGAPLAGARVSSDGGRATSAMATGDPAVVDSFYTLFSPAGPHVFTATMIGGYGPSVQTPTVVHGSAIRQDFSLPAGLLSYAPSGLQVTLDMGASTTLPFTLTNRGGLATPFEMREIEKGFLPTLIGPYQSATYVVKPFRQQAPTAQGLDLLQPPAAPPYAAGDVIQSWPSGLIAAWGIAYDGDDDTPWVASPSAGWDGSNAIVEYTLAGAQTGRSHPFSWNPAFGPADAAYNWNTGMLWIMNVDVAAGNNCIYEIDPASGYTGNRICPGAGFSVSQRGLAYDPEADTYFAGSWNDSMIHRFDSSGTILADVNVGLAVAGLAYNPDTQHLFVVVSADPNPVYVLDVANNYSLLGQFSIAGFTGFDGAGLEMDCDGNLWAVDQDSEVVYQVESGETTSACASDVPWLSEAPPSGSLPALANQPFVITFDAGVPEVNQPGQYRAQLKIKESTPYNLANVPVTMTVNAPPTWGQVHGRVYSLGYCDRTPSLLTGAQIDIADSGGLGQTFTQGSEPWSWWAPVGPVTITASAPNHVTQTVVTQILAGQGVNRDMNLRWLHNCGSVSPSPVDVALPPDAATVLAINLINQGTLSWTWSLSESASWLSITGPISGTSGPDSSLPSQLTIDTAGMLIGATHTARVDVTHDDDQLPNPLPLLIRVTVGNYKTYLPVVAKGSP